MSHESKTAEHTPGPWVWRSKDGGLYRKGKPPHAYGDPVLVPEYEYETGIDTIVSKADATLIAAAPDLLEGLKLAHDYLAGNGWEGDPRMKPIIDALDKAEGIKSDV
jgi:hypothetical protein